MIWRSVQLRLLARWSLLTILFATCKCTKGDPFEASPLTGLICVALFVLAVVGAGKALSADGEDKQAVAGAVGFGALVATLLIRA